MKMAPSFLNHVLRNSGAEKNIYLIKLLNDSTKHDLAEITIFSLNCLKQIPFGVHLMRDLPFFRRNRL